MTHNIRVSLFTLALGMTYGVGTVVVLFYNGVILGAVSLDYIQDGQTRFLIGWLLPHGSIEIPSVMITGQAGFVLASALLDRLAAVRADLVTLIGGFSLLLVWAGNSLYFRLAVSSLCRVEKTSRMISSIGTSSTVKSSTFSAAIKSWLAATMRSRGIFSRTSFSFLSSTSP
jgi:stage II sporulation SpoM-like protein